MLSVCAFDNQLLELELVIIEFLSLYFLTGQLFFCGYAVWNVTQVVK